ncbi:hypothetical protein PSN45_002579 [Yamadazyma tenuis]|uniref:EF-hand n=1 Tax=Candida tenuis (strain ATCC 10573 / BCRC 21748 / CBS 615 / JCM 9827 / NBRC 10315 / NRRL Y-1498 / VKM Y-70) TaxID=590646 RepID=G3AZZ1_CANTC|nr:uncharacterized protein CANTEDRAFT_133580 [Yamadazyma tenuis ATCC 10573]EGV65272.1 hypothetical protein CANTEDRAFT_133580 [Yamadazyma tenuis ATCC 10573]WEJ95070.1 hypothetical protein PSN45_002579 [Yamadazyma tenuis]
MSSSLQAPTLKVGLTPEEKRLYSQLFKSLDPEGTGVITGEKARTTFEKSGLPPAILGEIWQLADRNNLGFLTQFGFCYAMRLIGYTQAGNSPTPTLADTPGPLPKFAGLALPVAPAIVSSLQPQATNNSFMQSQPSAQVPQNTATYQSQPQDPIPPLNPTDYQKFSGLFVRTTGSPTKELSGASARDIFLKAKLPTDVLGQIWNLVDTENLGQLNMASFVVAMHLIQGLLGGSIKQLPPFLSDSIWQSAQPPPASSRQASYASVSSQSTVKHIPQQPPSYATQTSTPTDEWAVTPTMKSQYESIFANLDKAKTGQLNPDQVASFLMTSKLSQQDLAAVWDLADIQNTGVFGKLEFSIALFLVNRKVAGGSLPNIVPDGLIKAFGDDSASQTPTTYTSPVVSKATAPQQPPKPLTVQKTSIDELADVFGTPGPVTQVSPVATGSVPGSLQTRASSSDLTQSGELPKVRKNMNFRPTSSFGQSLLNKGGLSSPQEESPDLLGEDVHHGSPSKVPQPTSPPYVAAVQPEPPKSKTVNYDALRAVPPPPKRSTFQPQSTAGHTPPVQSPQELDRNLSSSSFVSPVPTGDINTSVPASGPPGTRNNDLLADPSTSAQFSQATSDIANISNQVKSLSSQTSQLHDNKSRATQELNKILTTKKEIESKLRILRTSYDNEVKQFKEVEGNLVNAKEETEALRSESSIAEAKFNALSTELNEKQVQMENLQKENGAVSERLGTVNAEISDLQNQLSIVLGENQKLSNQLSVRSSQVQVALVKKQDLESQLAQTLAANKRIQDEINAKAEEEAQALAHHQKLQNDLAEAKSFKPVQPEPKQSSSHFEGAIAGVVAGAAAGVGLGAVAKSILPDTQEPTTKSAEITEEEPTTESKGIATSSPSESKAVTSPEVSESVPQSVPVEALVDEVKEKAAPDFTGIEDNDNTEESKPETDSQYNKFDERTNTTIDSANSANGEGETPVTSPSPSEYQFPQGGMVGMPGVLVGVQRTDSLTSSVQNNAAMSVRDDNIEEFSDRDTIGVEEVANGSAAEEDKSAPSNQESDGDKLSSGVESFEIVNADDARDAEIDDKTRDSTSFVIKNPLTTDNAEEEFPPIKELDYDESDSSEDEDFHEAKDLSKGDLVAGSTAVATSKKDQFDSAFDDLEPAATEAEPEVVPGSFPVEDEPKDNFFDEFDNLEAAKAENEGEEEFGDNTDDFFNNDFTNSNMPDFSQSQQQPLTEAKTGNDEWEQLFAGFGNSQSAQNTPSQPVVNSFAPAAVSEPTNELVQELVGMGFDESTATEALQKEGWNLEAATNYLLDNA